MGFKLYKEPDLRNPVLLACWPGIGNVGLLAVDTIRKMLDAEELGEIEPWDFFYPRRVIIRNSELKQLEFPDNKFYFKKTEKNDLLFFIAEEQPSWEGKVYAEGIKAYQMANLVLDVALKFGCRRLFTSGAAVASIHHSMRSRVWATPNREHLISELRNYSNTVLMSDVEGRGGACTITGLNGLLLGVGQKRGLDGICLMGEIPVYLQGIPLLYPKASIAIIEVLTEALGVTIDMHNIKDFAVHTGKEIDGLYSGLPFDAKEQLDKLKHPANSELFVDKITDDDKKKILEEVDRFFKKGKANEN